MTALSGFRILELAEGAAGEYCGKLLADFGAEVIKLENPVSGSPTRRLSPLADNGDEGERSGLFAYLNTGKHSVALDLHSTEGKQALQQLLEHVDAVIDDHSAVWLKQVGLDAESWQSHWSGIVVCSITPFGLDQDVVAEDLNVIHSSGWGYHTPSGVDNSKAPLKGPGRFLVSYESALDAALCIVSSLYDREQSGRGQFIDISKQAVMASRIDYVLAPMIAGDMPVSTDRRAFDLAGPSGIFGCSDGFVYIWMSTLTHWQVLQDLMGEPKWAKEFPGNWLEVECTPARVAVVRERVTAWLSTLNKHEISAKSQTLGLTMVPLNNTPDLLTNEQFEFREFFQRVEHPVLGSVMYPTTPYKLSATPAAIRTAAPLLGQHTKSTLQNLSVGSIGSGESVGSVGGES